MKKTKGLKTQNKIIEAAIKCIATEGLHQTTFQKIADESGLSQPLVMHYFSKKDDIFPVVWDYVYKNALSATADRLKTELTPTEKLKEYLFVSWDIANENSYLKKIFVQLYFLSSFDEVLKSTNSQVKRTAVNRISEIIIEGQKLKEFNQSLNPFFTAKVIHNSISGFILNSVSEHQEYDYKLLLNNLFEMILNSLKNS